MNFKIVDQPYTSRYARWYRFFYDGPGVWWSKAGVLLAALLSILLVMLQLNPTVPLTIIFILRLLSFPRWYLFVTSDSPLSRAIIFILILHYLVPDNETVADMSLRFLTIYLGLIYFFSGYQKLKSPSWRKGSAMIRFAEKSFFWSKSGIIEWPLWLLSLAGWGVIVFELLFFTGVFAEEVAFIFVLTGFLFHGLLSFSLGLNHFFWTFLACYPVYLYTSGKMLLPFL
jgi:uncharacterized membrane protein YphA (DoxX/SURF4 family)